MAGRRLAAKTCVPCRGDAPRLEPERARALLSELSGWELFHDGDRIRRRVDFSSFAEAIRFVERAAEVAEEQGHHPDLEIRGHVVEVVLYTHAIGGLHENDFIMAAKIDQLLSDES
jgi:4a-hydroxytetrahydrobiopterin dehydratase